MHLGRKRQNDIETKIDCLYKQNLELITQNHNLLTEVNIKSEYTKTLEHVFAYILDLFVKKNSNENNSNPTFPSAFPNARTDNIFTIIEKSKDIFKEKEVECNNFQSQKDLNFKNIGNFPMLDCSKSYQKQEDLNLNSSLIGSNLIYGYSPKYSLNHFPNNVNLNLNYNFSSFDLFDEGKISRKSSLISNIPIEEPQEHSNQNISSKDKEKSENINDDDFFF